MKVRSLKLLGCLVVAMVLAWAVFLYRQRPDQFYSKVTPGLTKAQVRAITGEPHNCDSKYVWYFGLNKELPADAKWCDVMRKGETGLFLIFDERGILVTPVHKTGEGTPWEALAGALSLPKRSTRITEMLGEEVF
jgi:hypothetical protein